MKTLANDFFHDYMVPPCRYFWIKSGPWEIAFSIPSRTLSHSPKLLRCKSDTAQRTISL